MAAQQKAVMVQAGYRGDIERRRRAVMRLVNIQRIDPKKVAAKLGVSLATVYSDMRAIKKQGAKELYQAGPNGTPAATVLHDAMAASNERIRLLWEQVHDLQANQQALIEGLRDGAEDSAGIQHDYARAIKAYVTSIKGLFEAIRKEEEHQAKTLQRFGVIGQKIEINKKVTTRDETPLVKEIARFINENLPPDRRRELQSELRQRLQGAIIDAR